MERAIAFCLVKALQNGKSLWPQRNPSAESNIISSNRKGAGFRNSIRPRNVWKTGKQCSRKLEPVGTTSTSSDLDFVRRIGRRGSRPYQLIRITTGGGEQRRSANRLSA